MREEILRGGIIELALTGDIALRAADLGNLPAHPADRFIVATAIIHGATLMTADERLLKWKHGLERANAEK
jgi:PIN domain nuclease of toxin-antitoxin system